MNISGKPLILNTNDVLKTVNAKLKIAEVENEKKFVNESGDKITSLQISEEPINDLDAVNLKYVKNLFNELDIEYKKKFNELDIQEKKLKTENEIFKNGVEVLVKQFKSQIEKIKGDVARHTVNELRIQTEDIKKLKTENEIIKKQFNLLDKNITKWHSEVENRFNKINLPEKRKKWGRLKNLTDEEVDILEKVEEKINKLHKKEPKKKLVFTEKYKQYFKKEYELNDKEFEVYKRWWDSEE